MFRTLRMSFVITAFTALSVTVLTSLAEEARTTPAPHPPRRTTDVWPMAGPGSVRVIDLGRQTPRPEAFVLPARVLQASAG